MTPPERPENPNAIDRTRHRTKWERAEERRVREDARTVAKQNEYWSGWLELLPTLNYRVDLTLKQRVRNDVPTVPTHFATTFMRVRPSRSSTKNTGRFALYEYLTDEEVRKLAIRIAHRVNKELFGNRSRLRRRGRKGTDYKKCRLPTKLPALICQHDKDTRRHLHCLFAKPAELSQQTFEGLIQRAISTERFMGRVWFMEPVRDLRGSLEYNLNPRKSRGGDPLVYVCAPLTPPTQQGQSNAP